MRDPAKGDRLRCAPLGTKADKRPVQGQTQGPRGCSAPMLASRRVALRSREGGRSTSLSVARTRGGNLVAIRLRAGGSGVPRRQQPGWATPSDPSGVLADSEECGSGQPRKQLGVERPGSSGHPLQRVERRP